MKLVVISDTHAKDIAKLPIELLDSIADADVVIHAGDIGSDDFYSQLQKLSKKLYAVKGNNDWLPLPQSITEEFDGVKIAAIHSDRAPYDNRLTYLSYYFDEFDPNIIIYGHTHVTKVDKIANSIIINPGSPTKSRMQTFNSFVEITIDKGKIDYQIIKINK